MKRVIMTTVFLLAVVAVAAPVRFAILGDRTGDHQDSVHEKIVAEVAKANPDFVITVGDHIEGYERTDTLKLDQEWKEYKAIIAPLKMPFYYTPGNHDITFDNALGPYERNAGKPYYSFDYKGLHITVLDASRWEASESLPAEQLNWLASDLAAARKAKFKLVFYHKPFWTASLAEGKPDTLHSLFKKYGVNAVFNGHIHEYFSATYDGIKYTAIGSSGGETETGPTGILYHWAMVTVDDEKGITIEPILLGGEKRAWNDVTWEDIQSVDRNELTGLRFSRPVLVGDNLMASDTVTLIIRNRPLETPLQDTLRWDVPATWNVSPKAAAVSVAPGAEAEYRFAVAGAGRPFPAPKLTLRFPYAKGKSSPITASLDVARTARCGFVRKPPVIDGKVIEKLWQKPVMDLFTNDSESMKTDSVRFYFAADSTDLYLAAVCFDPHPESLRANATERDKGVHLDDCVGWFLAPDTSRGVIYQIYFNPNAVVLDQKITASPAGKMDVDMSWNADVDVKTTKGKNYWSVEAKLPLAQFGVTAKPGSVWGLNFRRKQPGRKANADWQPITYDPHGLGLMLMK
ncbi:MAG TPA: metallophosphoesterase [bacterium]|nr:metallophosphoesterase [bacterium]